MAERDPVLFALLLAAGGSRRLGTPKQLLDHDGETLVRRALRLAAQACGPRHLLVVGAEHARVLQAAGDGVRYFVMNDHWQQGLASSLTLGLACLPADCDGVLVLLTDQPLVDGDDLSRLQAAWRSRPEAIVASRYAGRPSGTDAANLDPGHRGDHADHGDADAEPVLGVPAIFPRRLFPELGALTGDRGARPVIERHRAEVIAVDCEHAALDVDTPADAAALGPIEGE